MYSRLIATASVLSMLVPTSTLAYSIEHIQASAHRQRVDVAQSQRVRSQRTVVSPGVRGRQSPSIKRLWLRVFEGDERAVVSLGRKYRDGSGVARHASLAYFFLYYAAQRNDVGAAKEFQALVDQMTLEEVADAIVYTEFLAYAASSSDALSYKLGRKKDLLTDRPGSFFEPRRVEPVNARNAQRRSDVNTILNAVYQYAIDHNGNLPDGIPTGSFVEICVSQSVGCTDLSLDILTESYLVQVPVDPSQSSSSVKTGYAIMKDSKGRVTVKALHPEDGLDISVTR